MLVLSRKLGEEICIGDDVRLVVYRIEGKRVQIGIAAPKGVPILRTELLKRTQGNPEPQQRLLKAK